MNEVQIQPRRGDIWIAEFNKGNGDHVQMGTRPILIIQNDMGNIHSPNVIGVALTSKESNGQLTQVIIPQGVGGLTRDSIAACESITTIGKYKLVSFIGTILGTKYMRQVNKALKVSLGL